MQRFADPRDANYHRVGQPAACRRAGRRLLRARHAARAPRHRHRCGHARRSRTSGWRFLPGASARAARASRRFPGHGRAAQRVREARGLRGHSQPDGRDARRSRCTCPGTTPTTTGAARTRRRARPRLRRGELEHLPGSGRARRFRTSTAASRTPTPPCARRPSRTTSTAFGSASSSGSKALTVWIGDGANFPGQQHLGRAFERYLESQRQIYAALPEDWRMFIEHKMYEPAFYATVIQDWGSSLMAAQTLGPEGVLPGRPRPPRAEREHRDDRRAAGARAAARRLPFQRFEVRRRRSRCRLDRSVPAVPDLQRAGGCRARARRRTSSRRTCSTSRTTSPTRSKA